MSENKLWQGYLSELRATLIKQGFDLVNTEGKLVIDSEGIWYVGVNALTRDGERKEITPFFKVGEDKETADNLLLELESELI